MEGGEETWWPEVRLGGGAAERGRCELTPAERRRRAEDYAVAVCVMNERHEMKMMTCVYGREGMTDRLCRGTATRLRRVP